MNEPIQCPECGGSGGVDSYWELDECSVPNPNCMCGGIGVLLKSHAARRDPLGYKLGDALNAALNILNTGKNNFRREK